LNNPLRDRRLLFLAPTDRDATTTRTMLAPLGVDIHACRGFAEVLAQLRIGAGAVLLAEEAATAVQLDALESHLRAQPPWSDLPILLLTRHGADSEQVSNAVRMLGNVTLLERPVRVSTLLSAVRTALRARERQYEIREHLAERQRTELSLRRADQRKDEFLATLGHELRNPLAPLLAALQLLKTAGGQEAVTARVTAVMERQINHLVRLVNDLLEVSRITRGLIEVRREPVDLAFVIHSAIDTSRPAIESAGHVLTVELPPAPIIVNGDQVRLTQVAANLLTNAAKYTNQGGRIDVVVRRDGDQAILSVRDNGIGLARHQLSTVFDMFTQVDRSSRRAQGGLGIGLTLVRSLVAMHGGSVEARSKGLGHGTEFVVSLPVLTERRPVPAEPPAMNAFPARRILIVDDNQDASDTLGTLLETLGATVRVAHTGREALDALDEFGPDSVVLDIGMPDMDGYEVARRIRAHPKHAEVLLIALTGWGQESDQRQAQIAGFDQHIVKPLRLEKLRELLSTGWLPAEELQPDRPR
jgi:signal transduction histidine kinase/ActR/RegA family two-component response regulator